MNTKNGFKALLFVCCFCFMYGCKTVTHKIVKPVGMKTAAKVSSLHPVFKWAPVEEQTAEISYDLAIWEGITRLQTMPALSGGKVFLFEWPSVSKAVYYREGIKDPSHKVQPVQPEGFQGTLSALKPANGYTWSVRIRHGEKVSKWACHDFDIVPIAELEKALQKAAYMRKGESVIGTGWARNWPFTFTTPRASKKRGKSPRWTNY